MIKIENIDVHGFEAAIRGMRNPKNSWEKIDSYYTIFPPNDEPGMFTLPAFVLGPRDLNLAKTLANAGDDHGKFLRMITVSCDITAPLYWWKEMDTYKIGTVADSCSTMHKIHSKEFTDEDFSCEHLMSLGKYESGITTPISIYNNNGDGFSPVGVLHTTIDMLNLCREKFLETKDKRYWWQMIQLLPSSYNQRRTVMLNYEVLAGIYPKRKDHKLDEWHDFCDWIKSLPYSEIITLEE